MILYVEAIHLQIYASVLHRLHKTTFCTSQLILKTMETSIVRGWGILQLNDRQTPRGKRVNKYTVKSCINNVLYYNASRSTCKASNYTIMIPIMLLRIPIMLLFFLY